MPVTVNHNPPFGEPSAAFIDVGLINNMPDSALEATERQFIGLLDEASGSVPVRLSLYTLPHVPRSNSARSHIDSYYSSLENLFGGRLDGLIVTGTEPRTPNLMDEPYWHDFTRVLDWAQENTLSSVWSCLAAHAAVLHLDGIGRRRLSQKRSGVFECCHIADHPLMYGLPARIRMPHSRWNDLPQDELLVSGYRVLASGERGQVDLFVKQQRSLSVFFQGHPEYETDTLFREYRRDVRRYLKGDTDSYPAMPEGYIDESMTGILNSLQERALSTRCEALLVDYPASITAGKLSNTWHETASRIYSNWFSFLLRKKARRMRKSRFRVDYALVS
jgi:homoserine O-succinyltransferase